MGKGERVRGEKWVYTPGSSVQSVDVRLQQVYLQSVTLCTGKGEEKITEPYSRYVYAKQVDSFTEPYGRYLYANIVGTYTECYTRYLYANQVLKFTETQESHLYDY